MNLNKITKRQYIIIEIMIMQSLFVGVGFSKIFSYTNKDSYISVILGTLIGIIILYFITKIYDKYKFSIKENTAFRLLYFIICCLLVSGTLIILDTLINSYYLYNTPAFVINGSFMMLGLYLALKPNSVFYKTSEIIFYLSMIILILTFLGLCLEFKDEYFMPLLTSQPHDLCKSTLIYVLLTILPNILLIDENVDYKTIIKGYLFGSFFLFISIFLYIGALGKFFLKIYSFPEYMALKKISFLNFIENVENISFIPWYFAMFTLETLAITKINDNWFKKSKIKTAIVTIACFLFVLIYNTKIQNVLFYYNNVGYIILAIFGAFLITVLISIKKVKK
jgi:hypothetical protein